MKIILKIGSFFEPASDFAEKSPFFTLVEGGRVDTKIN